MRFTLTRFSFWALLGLIFALELSAPVFAFEDAYLTAQAPLGFVESHAVPPSIGMFISQLGEGDSRVTVQVQNYLSPAAANDPLGFLKKEILGEQVTGDADGWHLVQVLRESQIKLGNLPAFEVEFTAEEGAAPASRRVVSGLFVICARKQNSQAMYHLISIIGPKRLVTPLKPELKKFIQNVKLKG